MPDEYSEVERPALDALEQLGWDIIDQQQMRWVDPRETESTAVLKPHLRAAIERLNPWINDNNLDSVTTELQHITGTNTMAENNEIHEKLIRHTTVEQDLGDGKQHQTVRFIDFDTPTNNEFTAINQFRVSGPTEVIKPDIVLFVNGIPLGVIECKSPQIAEPQSDALNQLTRYQNVRGGESEGAEKLFRYNLFSVATWFEGAVMGTYKTPRDQYKPWRDAYPKKDDDIIDIFGLDSYLPDQYRMLYALFEPERLLDHLRHYTVFETRQGGISKMVARYQQYRATEKALERIRKRSKSETRGGVVWHTQGSGKSLTMLFLALKLRREQPDPTLVLLTDRRALNDQIHATFERCGFPNPVKADSIVDLRERLRHEAGETITTLIHKFQTADEEDAFPVLSESDNIFVMADEAHRTQDKQLANNMRTALPNAFYIGFTGTPIQKDDVNTTRTFGTYIDTYTIDQSLDDGATVEILYQGRLADIHLEGEPLDRLFDRIFADKSEAEKAEIQKRYARTQDLAEAQPRINLVAEDIISHFEDHVPPPFKGLVVTTSKEAAVRYKQTLDGLHGPESRVIISEGHNDPEEIRKWTPTDHEKSRYKDSFVDPNGEVQLLIVCEMLLTGFDAPVAQVMYLDKPLREHNLLQAIARVNRPFPEKTHGLIIDYFGVSDDLKEALAMFSSRDVRGAMVPVADKVPDLEAAHGRAISFFADLSDVERCVQSLEPEDRRIEFKHAYKRFARLMDAVLPDPLANPYRADLERLSEVYGRAKERYRDDAMDLTGAGAKVRELIQTHITSQGIEILNPDPVSIMDEVAYEEQLEELESDQARASEMQNALQYQIRVDYDKDPIQYGSLRERLEELIDDYKQGRYAEREVIEEIRTMMDEVRDRDKQARQKGLRDEVDLSFYHGVEAALSAFECDEDDIVSLTKSLIGVVEDHVDTVEWDIRNHVQNTMRKDVKIALYQSELEMSETVRDELTNRVIELARANYA